MRASIVMSISSFVLLAAGVARADVPPPDVEACDNHATGATCMTDEGTTGTCTASMCSHASEPVFTDGGLADASVTTYACTKCVATTTTTTTTTCAPNAAACAGLSIGQDCVLANGVSGNCGMVTCGGTPALTCVEGKGSDQGGCNVGAADLTSTLTLLGIMAPFAAIRRKRKKIEATK